MKILELTGSRLETDSTTDLRCLRVMEVSLSLTSPAVTKLFALKVDLGGTRISSWQGGHQAALHATSWRQSVQFWDPLPVTVVCQGNVELNQEPSFP